MLSISFLGPFGIADIQGSTRWGLVDVTVLTQKTQTVTAKTWYIKCKDKDCFKIGDHAPKKENAAAIRKLKQTFPGLKEGTIRTFKQKVVKELNNATREKLEINKLIPKYSETNWRFITWWTGQHGASIFESSKFSGYSNQCKHKQCNNKSSFSDVVDTYVPTLLFWTGGSRFERTAPVLPFLPEIFRFEMILAWMLDIYEFSSSYKQTVLGRLFTCDFPI